jgi:hypothetical protein
MSKLEVALEESLASIQLGEATLEECLARYPELGPELRPLLLAAQLLKETSGAKASEQFKTRTRAMLGEHMRAHPRRGAWRRRQVVLSYAASLAVVALAFVTTGLALAQGALPGGALYPWKLASEQIWRRVHFDTINFDLKLTQRRLDELIAVQNNATLVGSAVQAYADSIRVLEQDVLRSPQKARIARDAMNLQKVVVNDSLGNTLGNVDDFFGILPRLDDLIDQTPQQQEQQQPTATEMPIPLTPIPTLTSKKEDGVVNQEHRRNLIDDILSTLLGTP